MPKTPKKTAAPVASTAQRLSAVIKTCRNLMRKDKGLNGDQDRLPILTWVMFLKFLDDQEGELETRAALSGQPYRPTLAAPYRWRDWVTGLHAPTGDDLLVFLTNERVKLPPPDADTEPPTGPGLFAYLRGLRTDTGAGRADIIAEVFRGVQLKMVSGYLLRDVLLQVNGIHFNATEEVFTLSHLYETMLREMRDAAGDSGEFYTPRPVVRLMVQMTDPRLGDTLLDPAAGTGGFLVAAYDHLHAQARTIEDRQTLQAATVRGGEAKPLPYLLCQMNLLLHGLDYPQIEYGNSLTRKKLSEMGEADRVDVILTNPPFAGEEERSTLSYFPEDRKSTETTLLFLQLIMRRLRRAHPTGGPGGRPTPGGRAVVVPNGTLFEGGIAGRIKQELLAEFDLHTVVRLPEGVFAPYTDIPANLLFFQHGRPTTTTWYYEVAPPEGRRKYAKTTPLTDADLNELRAWWTNRQPTPRAWAVDYAAAQRRQHALAEPHLTRAADLDGQVGALSAAARKLLSRPTPPDAEAAAKLAHDISTKTARAKALEKEARDARATAETLVLAAFNLDAKNPHRTQQEDLRPPHEILHGILAAEEQVAHHLRQLAEALHQTPQTQG